MSSKYIYYVIMLIYSLLFKMLYFKIIFINYCIEIFNRFISLYSSFYFVFIQKELYLQVTLENVVYFELFIVEYN